MNYEKLKKRRRDCDSIPTDSEGNLMLDNPNRISGTHRCAEGLTGTYYKKNHSGDLALDNTLGSYKQFNFGAVIPPEQQTDERLAGADTQVPEEQYNETEQ